MKKAVLTLCFAGLCLAASAHSRFDEKRHLGRHDYDAATPTASVPEVGPTFALILISVASLTVLAAYLRGRRGASDLKPPSRGAASR
jgi:hypothetical protein